MIEGWFSFLVQFHVPSRVCIDSLVLISVLENVDSLFVGSIFLFFFLVHDYDFFLLTAI